MVDRIETRVVHAGEPEPRIEGSVRMPIFQSAMFEYSGETESETLAYIRLNNTPNQTVLGRKLADLEGGDAALVCASGMSAISSTLFTLLAPGDHLMVQDCLYGGTHDLLTRDLPRLGIELSRIDSSDPGSWEAALRPQTKAIYVETISNPLMHVCELEAIAEFARSRGLVSLVDNTFASPINFRPFEWGFDVSLHSATKYLNGHSDIVAGVVIGSAEQVEQIRHTANRFGGTLDPHTCFLLHRGLATLALRVGRQNSNALALARFLEQNPAVARVSYPGLESHPQHALASRLLDGFGGMLNVELEGGLESARAFMRRIRIPVKAPSLGGVESLVTRPATTSHAGMSPEERARAGIGDGLIRISVGIEAIEDLTADFGQALAG